MFKKAIIYPTLVFLAWRLIIFLFQIFIQPHYLITADSLTLEQRLFTSWTIYWDAGHYLTIATSGYQFPQQAFFPLWPLLIKLATLMGFSSQWASYLLTLILSFCNFVLLYLLAVKLVGKTKALWAIIIFSCYPATVFLHAGYSENLFLFFTLFSFFLLENKRYWLSAIVGGLSTATRMVGIATSLSFWFIKIFFGKRLLMSFMGISGLLLYMVYLYFNYGDFWFFIKGQQAWCEAAGRCQFTFPLVPLLSYAHLMLIGWVKPSLSHLFIDWISAVIFLAFLPMVWNSLPKHYFIYSLVTLIMPLLSGTTISMTRMTLIVFPFFLVLPHFLKRKWLMFVVSLMLLLLELRFVALFTGRIWVA
ncbi:glycosyltransferase family 39 protein [Candidatus Daviesbacteria bacterium]|nr:glycosyltransferase family 39 protein [Candidatus Daviesbacteria bacterium]